MSGSTAAVAGIPPKLRGARPPGAPHSPWQLLEHLRLAQPTSSISASMPSTRSGSGPTTTGHGPRRRRPRAAWDGSIAAFVRDRRALQKLAADPAIELTAKIPHGSGQTYLREIVLVADHTAYHVGQLVLVRQLLGAWKRADAGG